MPTPNYAYEKRQRELAKKRKAEEKRQKKLSGGGGDADTEAGGPAGNASDSAPPRPDPGTGAPASE